MGGGLVGRVPKTPGVETHHLWPHRPWSAWECQHRWDRPGFVASLSLQRESESRGHTAPQAGMHTELWSSRVLFFWLLGLVTFCGHKYIVFSLLSQNEMCWSGAFCDFWIGSFLREKVRSSLQREVYNIPVFLACSFLIQMSLSPQIAVHINLYLTGEE